MLLTSPWLYILIQAFFRSFVEANTEIINFEAVNSDDIVANVTLPWEALTARSPERDIVLTAASLDTPLRHVCDTWTSSSSKTPDGSHRGPHSRTSDCPHEVWVLLDLDDPPWQRFRKFTLRISWPASYPADFLIETLTPSQAASLQVKAGVSNQDDGSHSSNSVRSKTLRQYARIRAVSTGVRPPPHTHLGSVAVPFTLLLEPLYLGVLPASVVPVLGLLLPVIVVAGFLVMPRAHAFIAQIAEDVRTESERKQE
ncbi:hypothetical protein PsYK624_057700 [Phanerochaete sordida]|uniref:Uncharacterized protein n=1 Tax=Phanerochaete sordida TaxID=48140 RepID=A0A9P3LCK1_9APHY|nr:hypothetical protein PsYK624_057700 [Phanerochaete sordida]